MKYVSNAFSPKMLDCNKELTFQMEKSSYGEIQMHKKELVSSIGHQNIADHLQIEKNRINILLDEGDLIYVVTSDKDNHEKYNYWKITIEKVEWGE
ncbi:MAG: hypothetical protein BZ137_00900 [Methanosphaera sp. rholeuAM130]|nr:DUF1874 domain-containing protein [Methanosphaera sp.]RAP54683.1 MAG: hypothetical protein BZ137_00900 [Methanosphaera sp. rholeuAM130]